MKSLGTPLVSDDRYIYKKLRKENMKLCKRMFLHNIMLSFNYNNKNHTTIIPLPQDLHKCLEKMNLIKKYKFDKNNFIKECDLDQL